MGEKRNRVQATAVHLLCVKQGNHGLRANQGCRTWHVPMLEFHCTGYNRRTYDKFSPHYFYRYKVYGGYGNMYNWGVGYEFEALKQNLVVYFGMN